MVDTHPCIDYPTGYVFKVIGRARDGYPDFVRRLLGRALGRAIDADHVRRVRPSSKGTYLAVTVEVMLVRESERQAVYRVLWDSDQVIFYL